jgi:hypothetical protein
MLTATVEIVASDWETAPHGLWVRSEGIHIPIIETSMFWEASVKYADNFLIVLSISPSGIKTCMRLPRAQSCPNAHQVFVP